MPIFEESNTPKKDYWGKDFLYPCKKVEVKGPEYNMQPSLTLYARDLSSYNLLAINIKLFIEEYLTNHLDDYSSYDEDDEINLPFEYLQNPENFTLTVKGDIKDLFSNLVLNKCFSKEVTSQIKSMIFPQITQVHVHTNGTPKTGKSFSEENSISGFFKKLLNI